METTKTRFQSRLARVWLVVAAASVIVVGILGMTSLLGLRTTTSTTTAPSPTPIAAPEFDPRTARLEAETWWALVIGGEIEAAQRISHPDAAFNFAGLTSSLGLERGVAADVDSERFGSADLPQLCFAISARIPIGSGSVVFRLHEGEWMLWEVRPSVDRCLVDEEPAPIEPEVSRFEVTEPVPLTVFTASPGSYSLIDLQDGVITIYPPESHQIENFAGAVIDRERRIVVWSYEPTVAVFEDSLNDPIAFFDDEELESIAEDDPGVAPVVKGLPTGERGGIWLVGLGLDELRATLRHMFDGSQITTFSFDHDANVGVHPVGTTESGLILNAESTLDGEFVDAVSGQIIVVDAAGNPTVLGPGEAIAVSEPHVAYLDCPVERSDDGACYANSTTGSTDLFVLDLETGDRIRIDKPHNGEWIPIGGPAIPTDSMPLATISPDGSTLLIVLGRFPDANGVPATAELFSVDLATGETRALASFEERLPVATWSVDGTWVVLFRGRDVTVIEASNPENVFEYPDLIPDGQWPLAAG